MGTVEILEKELTEKIIGACFEVSNELGAGFLESVYEKALLIALRQRGLKTAAQVPVKVLFREQPVGEYFSDVIASRFQWYRTILEPYGPGGTIVNVICSGSVSEDTENMIEDMVRALAGHDDKFDLENWSKRWRGEKI